MKKKMNCFGYYPVIYHNNILLLKQGKTYYGKGKHNNETHMVRNSKHFDDAFPPISRNIDTKKLKQKTDVEEAQ